jgi:hypothetical protein
MKKIIGILGYKYVYLFYSHNSNKIFVLIRISTRLLKQKAELNGYKLLIIKDDKTKECKVLDGSHKQIFRCQKMEREY